MLIENEIDVLCMQELEVNPNINCDLLSLPGYFLEMEFNQTKIRAGIYIKSTLSYARRRDLENKGFTWLW